MVACQRYSATIAVTGRRRAALTAQSLQDRRGHRVVDDLAAEERIAVTDHVLEPESQRIIAERACHEVDVLLPSREGLKIGRRAHVRCRQRVRIDAAQIDPHVRDTVGYRAIATAREQRRDRLGGGVGAAVVHDGGDMREEPSVFIDGRPQLDGCPMPRRPAAELFGVIRNVLHGPPRHAGQIVAGKLVGREPFAAEITADGRRLDDDVRFG